jgi:hypothetical protein
VPGKFRRAAGVGKSLKLLRARAKAPRARKRVAHRFLVFLTMQGSSIVAHYR